MKFNIKAYHLTFLQRHGVLNLTCLHCLQQSFCEHLFNLYYLYLWFLILKYVPFRRVHYRIALCQKLILCEIVFKCKDSVSVSYQIIYLCLVTPMFRFWSTFICFLFKYSLCTIIMYYFCRLVKIILVLLYACIAWTQ